MSAVGDDAAGSLLLAQLAGQGLSTQCVLRCHNAATPCVSMIFDHGALTRQERGITLNSDRRKSNPTQGAHRRGSRGGGGRHGAVGARADALPRAPPLARHSLGAGAGAGRQPAVAGYCGAGARLALLLLLWVLHACRPPRTQPVRCLQEACAAATAAGVPVFFEPVSAAKAVRAAPSLHRVAFLTPNAAELAALAAEVRKRDSSPPAGPGSSAAAPSGGGAIRRQHARRVPHGPPAAPAAGGQPGVGPPEAGEGPGGWAWQRGAVPAADCAEVAARLAAAGPDLVTVLAAGAGRVLLTLGALGAAACRLGAGWQHHRRGFPAGVPCRSSHTNIKTYPGHGNRRSVAAAQGAGAAARLCWRSTCAHYQRAW